MPKVDKFEVNEDGGVTWRDENHGFEMSVSQEEVMQMAMQTGVLKKAVALAVDMTVEAMVAKALATQKALDPDALVPSRELVTCGDLTVGDTVFVKRPGAGDERVPLKVTRALRDGDTMVLEIQDTVYRGRSKKPVGECIERKK